SPLFGDTVSVRVTVSVKPLAGAIVIVEDMGEPTFPFMLDGLAVTVKSSMVKVAVAEWMSVPLVPVMVSVYVPAMLELQETVAVPEPVMLDGLIGLQFSPEGTESVRLTVPVNPFRAMMVIVDWAEVPTVVAGGDDAAMEKSATE